MIAKVKIDRLTDGSPVASVVLDDELGSVVQIDCINEETAEELASCIDRLAYDVRRVD